MKRELLFQGKYVRVVRLDDHWEAIERHQGVVILALRQREGTTEVLMVKQFRYPIGAETWELPAGLIDEPGESAEATANRELAEEAGFSADLALICSSYSTPGLTDEKLHLYHATNLREHRLIGDDSHQIEAAWQGLKAIYEQVLKGEVVSSIPTLLGLTHALLVEAGDKDAL